jgi:hypothetical protein
MFTVDLLYISFRFMYFLCIEASVMHVINEAATLIFMHFFQMYIKWPCHYMTVLCTLGPHVCTRRISYPKLITGHERNLLLMTCTTPCPGDLCLVLMSVCLSVCLSVSLSLSLSHTHTHTHIARRSVKKRFYIF